MGMNLILLAASFSPGKSSGRVSGPLGHGTVQNGIKKPFISDDKRRINQADRFTDEGFTQRSPQTGGAVSESRRIPPVHLKTIGKGKPD